MADHEGEPLAAQVARLRARVVALEGRLAALEAGRPRTGAAAAADDPTDDAPWVPALPPGAAALGGRALLVLAGAYLVRALADAGVLGPVAGATLGLLYAAFWLLRADRDGAAGRRAGALVHAAAASAVAFPLVFEATARFAWLGASGAGLLVLAVAASSLLVARRRRLPASAWIATLGACGTIVSVLPTTRDLAAGLLSLLALAALVEWLALDDWRGLRWAPAVASDAVAALLVAVAALPEPPAGHPALEPRRAAAALLALPVPFLAAILARALLRGARVTAFQAVQGTLALAIGLVGARRVLAAHGVEALLPALVAVALAALAYAAAFAHAERRPGQGRNFYFCSTAGGLLMLAGTLELHPAGARALAWTAFGTTAALLGRRFDRTTLRAHGAAYLVAAAVTAGLATAGVRSLAGLPPDALQAAALAVAAGAGLAWAALASEPSTCAPAARLPRLALAAVVALALAAVGGAGLATAPLGPEPGARAFAGSALAAALALSAAWLVRRGQFELAWLAYPLAFVPAARLLLSDLPAGRAVVLVPSLALCGGLLILMPRLLRERETRG